MMRRKDKQSMKDKRGMGKGRMRRLLRSEDSEPAEGLVKAIENFLNEAIKRVT